MRISEDEMMKIVAGCINNDRICQEKFYRAFSPKMFSVLMNSLNKPQAFPANKHF